MASTGLDFSKLTAPNGAVESLRELIFLAVANPESIGGLVNFLPNQKHGQKAGFVGEFGLVGKASTGCEPNYGTDLISTSEKTWDIPAFEIAEKICASDLYSTLLKVALKRNTKVDDLTGSEYVEDVVAPRLELAIKKAILRFVFFGDKNITSSELKSGVSTDYFSLTDGIWKQLFAGVAAGKVARVNVAANTATSAAAQRAAIYQAGVATGIVDELIANAPVVLRQQAGQRIYVTFAFKDALDADIRKSNKGSDLQWESIFDGVQKAQYNGIEIVAVSYWDEVISNYLANSTNPTALDNPYRAIYTVQDNLLVGTESEDAVADIDLHFDPITRLNYIYAKDSIGALVAQDDLVVVAY